MRVALITEAFLARDGVGRSILSKIRHLEAAGHQVTVWMESAEHLTMPGQEARVRFTSLRDVLKEARGERRPGGFLDHDVWLYEYPTYFPLLETARLLCGRPVVFDFYGVTPPEYFPDEGAQDFIRRSLAETRLMAEARMVLVHSAFSGRELAAHAPVPEERVRVLPIALDPRYIAPPPPEAVARVKAELGLEGRHVLLYVGRMAGNKGIATLVEALAHVVRERPDTTLLLAGEDRRHGYAYFRGFALTRALELGVEKNVRFLGQVSEETLHALYGAADVLVSASLHEGFGLPVAEAMACGTPCVVTQTTALPETAGEGALYFAPHDASGLAAQVLRVAREEGLRRGLGEKARVNARRFHPEVVAKRLCELLEEARALPVPVAADPLPLLSAAARLNIVYRDELAWPVVGPALSWLRRKITLHLEKFFLRPLQENVQIHAQLATEEIAALRRRVAELTARIEELEAGRAGATDGADRREPPSVSSVGR